MKNCLGIEIGHYRIKIAYAEKGELKEFISERVQGMDLTDMHVCADLIKDLLKEYAIRCRNVVFVIRQKDVYVRRFEMPLMTEEQLRLNLPYEFHDYIGDEMDKYVFDYAMIQTKERTMDLLGAACTKTLSQQFEKLAKTVPTSIAHPFHPCGFSADMQKKIIDLIPDADLTDCFKKAQSMGVAIEINTGSFCHPANDYAGEPLIRVMKLPAAALPSVRIHTHLPALTVSARATISLGWSASHNPTLQTL